MTTKIRKWGNSYAVRIPKEVLAKLSLRDGSAVSIRGEVHGIAITPIHKKETLAELVSQIDHLNEEVTWGTPIGKEVW